MRVVVQRVSRAKVVSDGVLTGQIGKGLLVFLGIGEGDGPEDVEWLVAKLPRLRIFEDQEGRMNLSVLDVNGEILLISQFTLYGQLRKGTRPSFNRAAPPENAKALYQVFHDRLAAELGKGVPAGVFAAMMEIEAINDGPVTLIIDSRQKDF